MRLVFLLFVLGCDEERTAVGDLAVVEEDAATADLASEPGSDLAWADLAHGDLSIPPIPTTTLTFTDQSGDVLNPERGWFGYTAIGGSFSKIRAPTDPVATPPTTVTTVKMDLDQTQATIPAATLAALVATSASARTAGVKLVLRPLYRPDDTAPSGSDPTNLAVIVSHVHQLGQTLRDQADVILSVELGMLGPWGEFHTSGFIDDGTWVGILDAMLDELPASRTVQVRRPCHKDHFFSGRGPLTPAEAFGGTKVARVGHFNDCFLADTIADEGTYQNPTGVVPVRSVDDWRTWAATDTSYTFVGGETCGNNARASCTAALDDLVRFHWSFLGYGWYQPTVGPAGVLATCRDEITRRLGYRLVLEEATISAAVRTGDRVWLAVRLRNDGFAPPINPRPLFVVLSDATHTWTAELTGVDPRRWAPGTVSSFSSTLQLPAGAADGTYSLSLWLPDAATSLRNRPEYAIRFVNQGTWSASSGTNTLTTALTISSSAPTNPAPPNATFQ